MMKKLLSIFLVLVLAFSGVMVSSKVTAQNEAQFEIKDIDIDGTDMDDIEFLYVERGETLNIRVEVGTVEVEEDVAIIPIEDVKIRVEIDGYEYDLIDDVSDMFDIEQGVRYVKHLRLTIPEDIDANENYKLRIRVYNQEDNVENDDTSLRIKAQRHLLSIQDVIFTPGLTLDANQPLFTIVRIENMGDKKQEDIRVEVRVPQLGKSGVTYIDELVPREGSDEYDEDEETSESSDAIFLDLRGAQPGEYDLIVKVDYNRGHDELTKSYKLIIQGVAPAKIEENVIINAAETSKSVISGQGIVYGISIANMGTNARSFTAEVIGLDWGSYRVDPIATIVQPAGSADLFVYVSPREDVIGQKAFTVNVKEGNNVVKQINFQANIAEEKSEWSNVLTGLEIGFVVLLVILVILGIILAATKMGKKESSEEPLGENYY